MKSRRGLDARPLITEMDLQAATQGCKAVFMEEAASKGQIVAASTGFSGIIIEVNLLSK